MAYDLAADQVHCLDSIAAAVYRACDGLSVAQIASATGLEESVVAANLAALVERRLVDAVPANSGTGRRSFLVGVAGAAVAAGVWTIAAPSPAMAASGDDTTTDEPTTTTPF